MMLNLMVLIFTRLPDQAPFFIRPLLRAIGKKVETGTPITIPFLTSSVLWTAIGTES